MNSGHRERGGGPVGAQHASEKAFGSLRGSGTANNKRQQFAHACRPSVRPSVHRCDRPSGNTGSNSTGPRFFPVAPAFPQLSDVGRSAAMSERIKQRNLEKKKKEKRKRGSDEFFFFCETFEVLEGRGRAWTAPSEAHGYDSKPSPVVKRGNSCEKLFPGQ